MTLSSCEPRSGDAAPAPQWPDQPTSLDKDCYLGQWISFARLIRVAGLSACVGLAACTKNDEAPPPRTIETVMVEQASGNILTVYAGQVVSRYSGSYGFRIGGMIVDRPVEVGEQVTAGQLLAQLDPKDMDVSVHDAMAQTASAAAQAQALTMDLKRARQLAAEGFISQAELDRVQADAESAQAKLRSAKTQQRGADQQHSYTVLRAAHAGVVTAVQGEAGEVVSAGQPIVTIEAPGTLEVAVSVPEGEVSRFRSAQLGVRLWTDQDQIYSAQVRTLSAAANPQTRTFDARVSFSAPTGTAAIGGTAEVVVQEPAAVTSVRVPLAAVIQHEGQSIVWVVSSDPPKAQPRAVTIQAIQDNAVLLSSGIARGDRVVSAGAHLLQPDQVVRPVPSSASTNQ